MAIWMLNLLILSIIYYSIYASVPLPFVHPSVSSFLTFSPSRGCRQTFTTHFSPIQNMLILRSSFSKIPSENVRNLAPFDLPLKLEDYDWRRPQYVLKIEHVRGFCHSSSSCQIKYIWSEWPSSTKDTCKVTVEDHQVLHAVVTSNLFALLLRLIDVFLGDGFLYQRTYALAISSTWWTTSPGCKNTAVYLRWDLFCRFDSPVSFSSRNVHASLKYVLLRKCSLWISPDLTSSMLAPDVSSAWS